MIKKLQNWETVGFVHGNGTTTEFHSYSFTDKNVNPGNYIVPIKAN